MSRPVPDPRSAVLVTGCSTGVGHAAALRFLEAGHPVYATARRQNDLTALGAAGAVTLALDVTDEDSMTAGVERVESDHGAVGVLVNNAGYGLQAAVEVTSLDAVRTVFETNLFGAVRLCQLVLPAMRARGVGRIINVSAMGGHITFPGTGALHATKHALRAVSNALRLEVRDFGVAVSLVEPGPVRTPFADKANATLPPEELAGPYHRFHTELAARLDAAYQPGAIDLVASPKDVAQVVLRAAHARRPRARYPVGAMSRTAIMLTRLLPDTALDAVIRWQFPTPEPAPHAPAAAD